MTNAGLELVDYHRIVDEDLTLAADADAAASASARRAWAFPQLLKADADGRRREDNGSNVVHPGLQQAMRFMDEALSLVDRTKHQCTMHRPCHSTSKSVDV